MKERKEGVEIERSKETRKGCKESNKLDLYIGYFRQMRHPFMKKK
jgi:hypothetical protein